MLKKMSPRWILIIGWVVLALPAAANTIPKPSETKPDARQPGQAAQKSKENSSSQAAKPATAKGAPEKAQSQPAADSGAKFQPTDRRDPFLNPLLLNKSAKRLDDEEELRGQPPPGIAGMYIAQVKLQGISSREGSQLAVFRGSDNRAYFLQEGDKLFDGFVKTIGVDSVLLVREAKLRSGKTISQEITKRLRTP
jgi:hypothetical protein